MSAVFAVILISIGCMSTGSLPIIVRPASQASVAKGQLTLIQALAIADSVAERELAVVEAESQQQPPFKVTLPLTDYTVSVTDDAEIFMFRYEHDNPNVEFVRWLGHGMHFWVKVNRLTGEAEIIGGQ